MPNQYKDSKVRQVVVPTGIINLLPISSCNFSKVSTVTEILSACMLWSLMNTEDTGLKVPAPTCSVRGVVSIPFALSSLISLGVKCSPAVGAATEPSASAKTV